MLFRSKEIKKRTTEKTNLEMKKTQNKSVEKAATTTNKVTNQLKPKKKKVVSPTIAKSKTIETNTGKNEQIYVRTPIASSESPPKENLVSDKLLEEDKNESLENIQKTDKKIMKKNVLNFNVFI